MKRWSNIRRINTVPLPAWSMPYIYHSDMSGLTPFQIKQCDTFLSWLERIDYPDKPTDQYHADRPAFGDPCLCVNVMIGWKDD